MLGEEIRETRLKAGLTQEELAFKAGLARNYISLLELNQKSPTVDTLFRIAEAMDMNASSWISAVERQKNREKTKRR